MKAFEYLSLLKTILFLPKKVPILPRNAIVDVTTYCNLKCSVCRAKEIIMPEDNNKHLSFDLFKKIIDEIRPLSVNMATNGEPFLNPDFFKMVRYAKDNHITTITSSSFILSKKIIERIPGSGLDILKISIDGARKETYERMRGNNFDVLIENIGFLKKLLKEKGLSAPNIRFDFVINKLNYMEIPEFIDFALGFNVQHVFFHPLDVREYSQAKKEELSIDNDCQSLLKELTRAYQKAKRNKVYTNLKSVIAQQRANERGQRSGKSEESSRGVCVLPWFSLYINVRGEISPCCAVYPGRNISGGNVQEGIKTIWNGARMLAIRKIFIDRNNYNMFEGCKYCVPMTKGVLCEAVKTFPSYISDSIKKLFAAKHNKKN